MAKISDVAIKLAWPLGTPNKVSKWPSGKPTDAYRSAKNKSFSSGEMAGRDPHFKAGASCDVFVGTCVRTAGYDKDFPPGLIKQINHVRASGKWKKVSYGYDVSKLKPGDVMFSKHHHERLNRGSNMPSHIFIYIGNSQIAQASAKNYYGKICKLSIKDQQRKEIWVEVYRATSSAYTGGGTGGSYDTSSSGGSSSSGARSSISAMAVKLAWPLGAGKKASWPSGAPTPEYRAAKKAAFGNRGWSAASRAGASCDVFAGTVIRACGYDPKFPEGLGRQYKHMKKSKKWQEFSWDQKESSLRDGDVMYSKHNKNSGYANGHIFFYVVINGKGYIANASANTYYGKIVNYYNRYNKSKVKWVTIFRPTGSNFDGADELSGAGYGPDTGAPIVLEKEIAKLYSSDNYGWVSDLEKVESESEKRVKEKRTAIKDYLNNLTISESSFNPAPLDVVVSYEKLKSDKEFIFKLDKLKAAESTSSLISYPNFVEAPVVELSFDGITIGGYNNQGDKYPNYISSMTVKKINGRINTYNINLVYQIRPEEDPNFIDKLLSRVGYLKPLKIKYGDSNSPGLMFKEESAVITDVKMKDNVSSSSITYSISAISSVTSADHAYFTFGENKGKPSTIINDLLYNSGEVSKQLLDAFPKMKDRSFVTSNNLIPSTDSEVIVGGMADVSPLTYLSHVVSCMMNAAANNTSYFLSYNDDKDGAYFKISEICPVMSSNVLYEVDVGYPGDNFVTNFQLCDNIYWPLIYEYNGSIPKWDYSIDNVGNITREQSNSLYSDNKFLEKSIINQNWWKSLTEFPISAKLTLKGLTIPVMLTTYIRINTLFYGQKDMASGIYVVTDQEDSISGNGYSTTLTLLRVSD